MVESGQKRCRLHGASCARVRASRQGLHAGHRAIDFPPLRARRQTDGRQACRYQCLATLPRRLARHLCSRILATRFVVEVGSGQSMLQHDRKTESKSHVSYTSPTLAFWPVLSALSLPTINNLRVINTAGEFKSLLPHQSTANAYGWTVPLKTIPGSLPMDSYHRTPRINVASGDAICKTTWSRKSWLKT